MDEFVQISNTVCLICVVVPFLYCFRITLAALAYGIMGGSDARQLKALRDEWFTTQQQLRSVSAQDQFSTWAKLRRKLDKAAATFQSTVTANSRMKMTYEYGSWVIFGLALIASYLWTYLLLPRHSVIAFLPVWIPRLPTGWFWIWAPWASSVLPISMHPLGNVSDSSFLWTGNTVSPLLLLISAHSVFHRLSLILAPAPTNGGSSAATA